MSTSSPTISFDPFEDGFTAWPYDQYRRLRESDPVHRSDMLHGWVLTRWADVNRMLRDDSVSVEVDNATPTPVTEGELKVRPPDSVTAPPLPLMDEPAHTRVRRLMSPPFRVKAVNELRATVERRVEESLDVLVAERGPTGTFDVILDFAYPLPVTIFCELLGVPDEDSPKFRRWCQMVAKGLDPVLDDTARAETRAASDEMRAYLDDCAERKRRDPGDDILSQLVHHEEDGQRLTHLELIAQVQTLYVAGHEPTTAVVGNGLRGLMEQPEQLRRIHDDPELLQHAVLELLRYDGPNQFVRRIAVESIDLAGTTIAPGDVVYPCVGAANHDPEQFGPDADLVDVERPSAGTHLQFGAGIHGCLGSHLARLQIEAFLGGLLRRFPRIEPAGDPTWSDRMVLRSVATLPVTYATTAAP